VFKDPREREERRSLNDGDAAMSIMTKHFASAFGPVFRMTLLTMIRQLINDSIVAMTLPPLGVESTPAVTAASSSASMDTSNDDPPPLLSITVTPPSSSTGIVLRSKQQQTPELTMLSALNNFVHHCSISFWRFHDRVTS
jgi:hypothetical protein